VCARIVCEDPGPFLWVMPAIDEVKTFSETRLQESMEACEPVQALRSGRGMHTALEMHFVSAPLILTGAGSPSKVSGKPIRYLFLDEEKDMRKGAVAKALKRVRSKWDSKVWRMSTPKREDDSIDRAFLEGDDIGTLSVRFAVRRTRLISILCITRPRAWRLKYLVRMPESGLQSSMAGCPAEPALAEFQGNLDPAQSRRRSGRTFLDLERHFADLGFLAGYRP
jgi:Phage terminase large subunit (GpA)